MTKQLLKNLFKKNLKKFFKYSNRTWYLFILFFLAFLDSILIIIPADGILISSSMITKKRWLQFGLSIALGSTLGGLLLIVFIEGQGIELLLKYYPELFKTFAWIKTEAFFKEYGLLVLFFVGIAPISQQPALILAALSKGAILPIFFIMLISRLLKFLFISYIASHTPKHLSKLWGLANEMKKTDVHIKS